MAVHSVQLLGEEHDVESFTCGDDKLDRWLRNALGVQAEGATRVFVLLDSDGLVLGFYALAMSQLLRQHLPRSSKTKRDSTPVILLAKLATKQDRQGEGIGSEALEHALRTVTQAADLVGGVYLMVEVPNPERRSFYIERGFVPMSDRSPRHYMKMSTARDIVAHL